MTSDESISVEAPASQELDARAMKAQVAANLFGEAATPIRVGSYELIETLGAGGMGVVYAGWDESLGRRVAIKVLPAEFGGDGRERARLVREAQALAKLSHPNVVQVYEVGTHEDSVFVAMELVEGPSLRQWQAEQVRSTSEILEVYAQAGQGLSAAHSAGLVHRDFKPANVLVGNDGRVRVVDFGLAQGPGLSARSTSATGRRLEVSSPGSVTRTGARAGTPAYMAPEQFEGGDTDARSDQFSFCVSLYEALVGCRPFDWAALLRRAAEEPVPAPARGERRLPWGLRRALRRGLAMEPPRRWPDMDALLRALEAGPRWRRRLWTWAGPVAVGVVVLALAGRKTEPACEPPEHGPRVEWSESAQQEVQAALLGTGQPFARRSLQEVQLQLGLYVMQWEEIYVQACRDGNAERYARVVECLDRDASAFSEVVRGLSEVDATTALRVGEVLDTLRSPRGCAWRSESSAAVEPVSSEVVRGLAKARVTLAQGLYAQTNQDLEIMGAKPSISRSVAYAELLELRGRALVGLEQVDRAQEVLALALALARPGPTRARTVLTTMELLLAKERWESVEDHAKQAEAAIEALDDPGELRADYLDLEGRLALEREGARADPDRAVELHQAALDLRDETSLRALAQTKRRLANAYAEQGDRSQALRIYQEVLEMRRAEVGPAHPEFAAVLFNMGLIALDSGEPGKAKSWFEQALRIEQAVLGTGSTLAARTEVMLAEALIVLGEPAAALPHARSAWAVQSTLAPGHSDRRAALRVLASAEQDAGELGASLEHQIELVEEFGAEQDPFVLHNIAWLTCQVGRCPEARPWLARARTQLEALSAAELPDEVRRQLRLLALYIDHSEALAIRAEEDLDEAQTMLDRIRREAEAFEIPPEDEPLREHLDKLLEELDAVTPEPRAER